ncbi:MAG: hypothetical protein IJG08_02955 [Oscillospiraceae bacterium]|nr:hypothetical protein [Oscillospiraceae bacterium]
MKTENLRMKNEKSGAAVPTRTHLSVLSLQFSVFIFLCAEKFTVCFLTISRMAEILGKNAGSG